MSINQGVSSSQSQPCGAQDPGARAATEAVRAATCENCHRPATRADDSGLPLCDGCYRALAAEAALEPAIIGHNRGFEGGYESGFADALNDVVPALLEAARAVVDEYKLTAVSATPRLILVLRQAIADAEARL